MAHTRQHPGFAESVFGGFSRAVQSFPREVQRQRTEERERKRKNFGDFLDFAKTELAFQQQQQERDAAEQLTQNKRELGNTLSILGAFPGGLGEGRVNLGSFLQQNLDADQSIGQGLQAAGALGLVDETSSPSGGSTFAERFDALDPEARQSLLQSLSQIEAAKAGQGDPDEVSASDARRIKLVDQAVAKEQNTGYDKLQELLQSKGVEFKRSDRSKDGVVTLQALEREAKKFDDPDANRPGTFSDEQPVDKSLLELFNTTKELASDTARVRIEANLSQSFPTLSGSGNESRGGVNVVSEINELRAGGKQGPITSLTAEDEQLLKDKGFTPKQIANIKKAIKR